MPFGIPCDEPPVDEMVQSLMQVNTQIGNLVYNVAYPIGERLTWSGKLIDMATTAMNRRVRDGLKRSGKALNVAFAGVAEPITSQLASAGETLDTIQRQHTQEQMAVAAIINGTSPHRSNAGALLSLLFYLGITHEQIRAYIFQGTLPDVHLCAVPPAQNPAQQEMVSTVQANGFWED